MVSALAEIDGHTFYLPALNGGSTVIDLGASTAGFARRIVELAGVRCICVEADARNFELIDETDRIEKHFFAAGGTDRPVTLHVSTEHSQWVSRRAPAGTDVTETVEVPGITLDGLVGMLKLDQIDLLKVDIETAEIELFDGASDETLRRFRQITVEFHDFMDPGQRPDVERVCRRLEGLGFDRIVFTRTDHGDVLFIDRRALGLSAAMMLYFRTVIKYGRGLSRMARRQMNAGKREAAA